MSENKGFEVSSKLLCQELTFAETTYIKAYVEKYGEDFVLNERQKNASGQMDAGADIKVERKFLTNRFEVKTYGNKKVATLMVN